MKKKRVVIIIIIISLAAVSLYIWQQDNIHALIYAATTDENKLAKHYEQTQVKLDDTLNSEDINVPKVSKNDISEVIDGTKTAREAAKEILKSQGVDIQATKSEADTKDTQIPKESTQPSNDKSKTEENQDVANQKTDSANNKVNDNDNEKQEDSLKYEVNLRVTELNVLQTSYDVKIDKLINESREEFSSLKKEEQTKTNKYKIAMNKASELSSLESECDKQVKTIVEEIRQLLTTAGKSTDLCENIMNYYRDTKAKRIDYYLKYIK